jgi:hypothetical protein
MPTYNFYQDPSHGWLKVPRQKLIDLNILNDISSCSYQRGQFVYLEEDSDRKKFVDAMILKGQEVKYRIFNCRVKQSKIRNYFSFAPYLHTAV